MTLADAKTALITGASSGIGRALAERFATMGIEVAMVARRKDVLDSMARDIESKGGRALAICADLQYAQQAVDAVEHATELLGPLDIVVANAGFGAPTPGKTLTWADTRPMLLVNVMSSFATITAALPSMVARGKGHLVGISSVAGLRGLPGASVYSATKAALSTFLEGLRLDLHGTGVHVMDVRPGFVDTPAHEGHAEKLPLLVPLDRCVDHIVRGLERGSGELEFPRALGAAVRVSRWIPDALAARLTRS
jgi:short-subunit dehydrogenase